MHVQASETDPTTIPPNPNETTTYTNTCISYTSEDPKVTRIPSLSIQNPNLESKQLRGIKRTYRGYLGNEEKIIFFHPFFYQSKHSSFHPPQGKTKTKGGAEKSEGRRTVAGKTTPLHRFRSFELDSGFYQIMEERIWLKVAVILCLFAVSNGRELKLKHKDQSLAHYNHTLATILVEYASAVYMSDLTELFTWTCSRCDDMTEGFEIIELVVDIQHCLQAFVGVAQDLNAVIIAFRGTQEHSIQNWVEDLYWKQLDLNYPGMPDAMVHHGFYYAYHNTTIRPGVLNAVKRAREIYGNMPIMVTGHSMGGAMASFCGLDLKVNHEAENVQVMTFGQPRIGNAVFVSYYSAFVPNTIRVTNEHDIVPHLPPYYTYFPQKTYHHFPREVWLYNIGLGSLVYTVEKECDGSGEDPTCSRSVAGNSIADHLEYYGVILHSESWNSCRIVMDPLVNEYVAKDVNGNFRLSKDPAVSVIKMNTRSGNGDNSV